MALGDTDHHDLPKAPFMGHHNADAGKEGSLHRLPASPASANPSDPFPRKRMSTFDTSI
jgi:hypothetical protein